MYIGWATNVNKIILDSTNITVGENATVKDTLETGGKKRTRLTCANPSDKYAVTMTFNFVDKDDEGLTELDRFYTWYKWRHKYGVNPFQFPAILINSNREQGYSTETVEHITQRILNGDDSLPLPDYEYYCITSAVEGSKSGHDLQLRMTWETYATDAFVIADDLSAIDHIKAENGFVDVVLTSTPTTEPSKDTWQVYITALGSLEELETINICIFDGSVTARLFFDKKTTLGTYIVRVGDFSTTFIVES